MLIGFSIGSSRKRPGSDSVKPPRTPTHTQCLGTLVSCSKLLHQTPLWHGVLNPGRVVGNSLHIIYSTLLSHMQTNIGSNMPVLWNDGCSLLTMVNVLIVFMRQDRDNSRGIPTILIIFIQWWKITVQMCFTYTHLGTVSWAEKSEDVNFSLVKNKQTNKKHEWKSRSWRPTGTRSFLTAECFRAYTVKTRLIRTHFRWK